MVFNGLLLLFSMFPPKGSHQSKFNWNYKHVKNYIVIHLISSQTKFPNVAIKKCLRYNCENFYNVGTVWWEGNIPENMAFIKCTNAKLKK